MARYGSIRDVGQMGQLFCQFDSYLMGCINKWEIMRGMTDSMNELIAWGVIIYNRNSVRNGMFWQISRSKLRITQRLIQKKIEVVRSLFTERKEGEGRTRFRDVVTLAHILQGLKFGPKDKMHQHLLAVMAQGRG